MLWPSLFPADFVTRGRVCRERTQRNVIKQAASGLAALALRARLADAKTLVNKPSGQRHES
jgi:hypothetical protein